MDEVVGLLGYSPPVVAVRARLGDTLVGAAADAGFRQVVSLAAGLESRIFRLRVPAELHYFEVDLPNLLEAKRDRLDRAAPSPPPCHTVSVPADLSEDWPPRLREVGFDPDTATVWLVEGLLPYLDEHSCTALLDTMRALSAPGNWLWCDHVHPQVLAKPEFGPVHARLETLGVPWTSPWTDPEARLAAHGWSAHAWTLADLLGTGTGRPPAAWMPPVPARMDSVESDCHWLIWGSAA